MNPTTVGTVGLGTTLAGGLLSAFGAEKSGQSQQHMYQYQAQVAKINSQIDLQNRDFELQKGETQQVQYGMKAAQQRGAIVTAQAGSGIDVNSGSALAVRDSQGKITGIDLAQLRANTAKTAYDYSVRSTMDTNQASLDILAGENAKEAGDINAGASILGTVGSVSSKWMQGKQAGMFA